VPGHGPPPGQPLGPHMHQFPLQPPTDVPAAYLAGHEPDAPDHESFVGFLKISLRRAFRLRIEPDEVLPSERAALAAAEPAITDPTFQAFLAWRRSVLFFIATALVPLSLLRLIEVFAEDDVPGTLRALFTIPVLAEIGFCALAWQQLRHWTEWRQQRRKLALGWIGYFLAPFVVYLYPLRSAVADMMAQTAGMDPSMAQAREAFTMLGGVAFALQAVLFLAPKAVSLMPGLVRAAIVTKLLFPGSAAPGWLIVLAAPLYALLAYVVLIVPYQLTGTGTFAIVILGVVAAQYWHGRAGYALARPQRREEAIATIAAARTGYAISMAVSALFLLIALGDLVSTFDFGAISIVTLLASFVISIALLTLISTDLIIASLDRARGITAGSAELAAEYHQQLESFVRQPDDRQP
jgi:hypothetical protein